MNYIERGWDKIKISDCTPLTLDNETRMKNINLILDELIEGTDTDNKWKDDWYNFFKRNSKTYVKIVLFNPKYTKYFREHHLFKIRDINLMLERYPNDIEFKALLLNYKNENFTLDEILESKMRELKKVVLPSDPDIQSYCIHVYNEEKKIYKIGDYKGNKEHLVVPGIYKGNEITVLGRRCFSPDKTYIEREQEEIRKNIKVIELPDTITTIEPHVFDGCEKLEKLVLSKNLVFKLNGFHEKDYQTIFKNCKKLKYLEFPEGIELIDDYGLQGSNYLQHVKLPSTLLLIGQGAFYSCALEKVDFSEGLLEIGKKAFAYNEKLKKLELPRSLERIREYAFYGCKRLEEVVIPNPNTKIDSVIFNLDTRHIILKGVKGGSVEEYAKRNSSFIEFQELSSL